MLFNVLHSLEIESGAFQAVTIPSIFCIFFPKYCRCFHFLIYLFCFFGIEVYIISCISFSYKIDRRLRWMILMMMFVLQKDFQSLMTRRRNRIKQHCDKTKPYSVTPSYLYVLKVIRMELYHNTLTHTLQNLLHNCDKSDPPDTPLCTVPVPGLVSRVQGGLHQLVPQPPAAGGQDGAADHGDHLPPPAVRLSVPSLSLSSEPITFPASPMSRHARWLPWRV